MGFEIKRTFTLDFTDTEWSGAIVKMGPLSIKGLRELFAGEPEDEARIFVDHLISWDLEFDGEPVPQTVEGFFSLEEPARDLVVKEWLRATRGISAPLDRRSKDGRPSEAPQMTMETL
jgi:hypothetical protein